MWKLVQANQNKKRQHSLPFLFLKASGRDKFASLNAVVSFLCELIEAVETFTRNGELVMTLGMYDVNEGSNHPELLGGPSGVWVDPDTNEVFISDGYRNRRVIDLINQFKSFDCNVDVYDPWINKNQVAHEYNILPIDKPIKGKYDAIVIAVAHDEFKLLTEEQIRSYGKSSHVLYDIKYLLKANESDGRL